MQKRLQIFAIFLVLSVLYSTAFSQGASVIPAISRSDIFPLSQLKEGMQGTARTVFRGTEPEEFGVEILGIVPGSIGPHQDLIIGKLSGANAMRTFVFAGMSGSRVYIDGKLVGAISYSLDADFTLLTGRGGEEYYVKEVLGHFESRIPGNFDYFVAQRILLIRSSNGIDIDIALGALPFEEAMIERAVTKEFSHDVSLPCCTAEDLVVMKAFAGRARDWMDVEGVVKRQAQLDIDYVLGHISDFNELRNEPDLFGRVKRLLGGAE